MDDDESDISDVDSPGALEAKLEKQRINARRIRLKKRALTNKRYCTPDEYEASDLSYKPVKSSVTAAEAAKDSGSSSNDSTTGDGKTAEKEEKKVSGTCHCY